MVQTLIVKNGVRKNNMAEDRININVAHLTPAIDFKEVEAVHSVGVSHLREYLNIMFGEEYPKDERDKRLVDRALGAVAVYSTNDELPDLFLNNPRSYIPHWLKYLSPVIDSTKALGRRTEHKITEVEQGQSSINNDLTIMVGLFDVISFVVASEFGLSHPRYQQVALMERSRNTIPLDHRLVDESRTEDVFSFDLLTQLPFIKAEHRKKMLQLRSEGQKIVAQSETNLTRLRPIIKAS